MSEGQFPENIRCKICGENAHLIFGLPKSKKTGHPIPDEPDSAPYYQCDSCTFLFTTIQDEADHTEIYDEHYWDNQDPDWYGRVSETLRLVLLSNELLLARADHLDILDFGCGAGAFVEMGRVSLQLNVWGTDINPPKVGKGWYLPDLEDRKFDVITACEVIEHIPNPVEVFEFIKKHLKSPGVFAFQTAIWDAGSLDRNWWYLGPDNGHISLYTPQAFDYLANQMRVSARRLWKDYAGVQAWLFK